MVYAESCLSQGHVSPLGEGRGLFTDCKDNHLSIPWARAPKGKSKGYGPLQARRRRDLSQWHERIFERGGRGLGPPLHEAANLVSGTEGILFEILQ